MVQVDGAIFISQQAEEVLNQILKNSKCPIVFIDSYNKTNPKAIMVGVDDYKGGYIATKYLISNGHTNIAFAGCYSETNAIVSHRYQGYRKALKESGIPYNEKNLINTFTRYEDGVNIGRDIANRKYNISAVFAAADLFALGLIEGARINGCVVPNDLSVIGFDNLDLCSLVTPKLTTVSQNVKKKAESAVNLLLNAIKELPIPSQSITLDVQLEVRQTVQKLSN
ncbi:hypothetical protein CG709_00130 [Lachnotalea glycerini]|nr:hypothetical protein CG709_00130 [Lachnotalea glycerini]